MIFIERHNDLQLVSQWPSNHVQKKHMLEGIAKRGAIVRAFRSGEPFFWRRQGETIVFLPISAPEQQPVGIIAMVLSAAAGFAQVVYDDLMELGRMSADYILRARVYEEALAARARAENIVQSK